MGKTSDTSNLTLSVLGWQEVGFQYTRMTAGRAAGWQVDRKYNQSKFFWTQTKITGSAASKPTKLWGGGQYTEVAGIGEHVRVRICKTPFVAETPAMSKLKKETINNNNNNNNKLKKLKKQGK